MRIGRLTTALLEGIMTVINTADRTKDLMEQARLLAKREKITRGEALKRLLRRRIQNEGRVETHVVISRRSGR